MLVFDLQRLYFHWEFLIMLLFHFPSCSKRDVPFHRIAYDYSRVDWNGLHDLLRDVPWEDIFKLSSCAAASEFCEWVRVEIDIYISLIESIRSSLTHLHCFQQLVLLL